MLKVGWIVARPEVLRRVLRIRDYTTGNAPPLAQAFADWAVRRHAFFVQRARRIVERNRALSQTTLSRPPPPTATPPGLGMGGLRTPTGHARNPGSSPSPRTRARAAASPH